MTTLRQRTPEEEREIARCSGKINKSAIDEETAGLLTSAVGRALLRTRGLPFSAYPSSPPTYREQRPKP